MTLALTSEQPGQRHLELLQALGSGPISLFFGGNDSRAIAATRGSAGFPEAVYVSQWASVEKEEVPGGCPSCLIFLSLNSTSPWQPCAPLRQRRSSSLPVGGAVICGFCSTLGHRLACTTQPERVHSLSACHQVLEWETLTYKVVEMAMLQTAEFKAQPGKRVKIDLRLELGGLSASKV